MSVIASGSSVVSLMVYAMHGNVAFGGATVFRCRHIHRVTVFVVIASSAI